ncbi:hypothetical protein [Leifsonia shinshuensis]|uniref:hypothetical protein n=1 Tax=Leifsonia shinshuensis TaxID=150026 RepID=UPI0035E848B6
MLHVKRAKLIPFGTNSYAKLQKNQKRQGVIPLKNCPYCQTKLQKDYCNFCEMQVGNNTSKSPLFKGFVSSKDVSKSPGLLKDYHTYDLLLLLRHCREQRREAYHLMRVIGRVKHESNEFKEGYQDAYQHYAFWTKKKNTAETLVKNRLGEVPAAVTNELLSKFYDVYMSVYKKRSAAM